MLKLFNTLTKNKEIFRPIKGKKVTMYTCGPTVYDYAHIGNMRSYVTADILRRFLEYKGFRVYHIKNITDVGHMVADADEGEDKVIKAAKKEKKTPYEIAQFYEEAFKQDEESLNVRPASVYPKATNFVPEMVKIAEKLLERGYAYEKNGSIYFDVSKFSRYGLLSGNTIEKLEAGARIKPNPEKRHPYDFALWKKSEPNRLMKWQSPWGLGFPGWHAECSVMSIKYLGETIDIHTGGEDNIFPHHENEIAASECSTDKKFVNFWIHTRHLLVDNKKMSKSLGNFHTIKDLEEKGHNPLALRYLYLTSHYRDPLNFTYESLEAAENTLVNLNDFLFSLDNSDGNSKKDPKIMAATKKVLADFEKHLEDDINTPKAMASVFEYVNFIGLKIKQNKLGKDDKKTVRSALKKMDDVLGFIIDTGKNIEIDEDIQMLIDERELARKEKDWAHADAIRDQIEEEGYLVDDTPWGVHIKRKPLALKNHKS